jgi:hypothetical protein
VLVECGFVRAQAPDGTEYTFAPSLARVAQLGSPEEIVSVFAALHGPQPERLAAFVLSVMCEQEDPGPLIGHWQAFTDAAGPALRWVDGLMPPGERVILAQHLMRHGIVGKAKPDAAAKDEKGQYSQRFDASEYVAAARVHFGLSTADAEAISMTEFQRMLRMKYPDADKPARDVPTREEYDAAMAHYKEVSRV